MSSQGYFTWLTSHFVFTSPDEALSGGTQKSEQPTEIPFDTEVSSEALLQSTELIENGSVSPPSLRSASQRATYSPASLMDPAYAASPFRVKSSLPPPSRAAPGREEGTLESDPEAYSGEDSRGGEERRHAEDGGIRLAGSGLRPASPVPTTHSIAAPSPSSTLPPPYAEYS